LWVLFNHGNGLHHGVCLHGARTVSPLSVIEPITVSFQRTTRILFHPFTLSKWLRLGFCSFLMGSLPTSGFGGGSPSHDFGSDWSDIKGDDLLLWMQEHLVVIVTVTGLVLVLLFLLGLVFTWLGSRGRFMLLDGVVRNRGAIAAPWLEYRREANSLFRFRIGLGLLSLLVVAFTLAPPLAVWLLDWRPGSWSWRSLCWRCWPGSWRCC
jgi:hypothetical protein